MAKMGSLQNDITLPSAPTDSISALRWSPHNHLAAASWDGKVYIYNVNNPASSSVVATIPTAGPVLDTDFNKDGTLIIAAGAAPTVSILDATTSTTHTLPSPHAKPIRSSRFVSLPSVQAPLLATGSWDGTIRFWDLRLSSPVVSTISAGDRVYAMDVNGNTLGCATAAGEILFCDLTGDLGGFVERRKSPLTRQMTCLSMGDRGRKVAFGGIEGRVGVQGCGGDKHNLTWRCHRDPPTPVTPANNPFFSNTNNAKNNKTNKGGPPQTEIKIWTINAVTFHPLHPTHLATAGSDGSFSIWHTTRQCRTRAFPAPLGGNGETKRCPITAAQWRLDGKFFAYAIGEDWTQGFKNSTSGDGVVTRVVVHPTQEGEILI